MKNEKSMAGMLCIFLLSKEDRQKNKSSADL